VCRRQRAISHPLDLAHEVRESKRRARSVKCRLRSRSYKSPNGAMYH
jgi:hypothetical protein